MATIVQFFTGGDDTYTADTPDDYVLAFLDGNDTLTVKLGNVQAVMGEGNDSVLIRGGTSTIYGESGDDLFNLYADGTVYGGGDDDQFNIRGGTGIIADGGEGTDRFNFVTSSSNILLHGGNGDDDFLGNRKIISGSIYGDAGNDSFVDLGSFSGRVVTLYGGTGNDTFRADPTSPATFIEFAGEGIDRVLVSRGHDYTLPDEIENLLVQGLSGSTSGAATLTGNASSNSIIGHSNAETINGLDGNDRLYGKTGDDSLFGGNGNDLLDGSTGDDVLTGEAGNDTMNGRAGSDTMTGGAGNDNYYVDSLFDVVTENAGEGVDVVRVTVDGYVLAAEVEKGVIAGSGAFTLEGNGLDNVLIGNSDNNTLLAWAGNDDLRGGAGDDGINGGIGDDKLNGGTGSDYMAGGAGNDTYYVDDGNDLVQEFTGEGTDTVISSITTYGLPSFVENAVMMNGGTLTGNSQDNELTGSDFDDTITGGDGNDTISSGEFGDFLFGDDGIDTIDAGGGDDYIFGGAGKDFLTGGSGFDVFYYGDVSESSPSVFNISVDAIQDFESNLDKIDLSTIDADLGTPGDQAFTWVGNAPNGTVGQAWLVWNGGGQYTFYADVDGDNTAEMQISFSTVNGVLSSDFIL